MTKGSSKFTLLIRYPGWVKAGKLKVIVNNTPIAVTKTPSSYFPIKRLWKKGDTVMAFTAHAHTAEHLPNLPEYTSPCSTDLSCSAQKQGTEDLKGLLQTTTAGDKLPMGKGFRLTKHQS